MITESLAFDIAALLLTYLVHSTLLVATAFLLEKFAREVSWQDTLWKVALIGGLVTAPIQVWSAREPSLGRITLTVDPTANSPTPQISQPAAALNEDIRVLQRSGAGAADTRRPPVVAIILIWIVGALILLMRLLARQLRMRRTLATRVQVADSRLSEMLTELRRNAGIWKSVRLSSSSRCSTPLAFGADEICVPDRFIDELKPDEQRAALAHELAHLERRDPLWHFIAAIVEAVMFFQPLNRLSRRKLREAAEYLSDDWAVRQLGSETELARCLAAVASWVVPDKEVIPAGTMAMAEGGSPLLSRVSRLLNGGSGKGAQPALVRAAGAAVLIAVTVAAAPVVDRVNQTAANEPQTPSSVTDEFPPDSTDVGAAIAGDLERSALQDPDPGVRRAAAEAMGDLHPSLAAPALIRTIWRSRDEGVQVEATEALGEVGNVMALNALDSIAWRHPSKLAALKALEAMSEFGTSRAATLLRAIARSHPEVRMRKEAVESLGEMTDFREQ